MKCLNGVGLAFVYSIFYSLALGYSFDANITSQMGRNGAVASETEACSRAGASMLNKGGNAADAVSEIEYIFLRGKEKRRKQRQYLTRYRWLQRFFASELQVRAYYKLKKKTCLLSTKNYC